MKNKNRLHNFYTRRRKFHLLNRIGKEEKGKKKGMDNLEHKKGRNKYCYEKL